jgi:heme-degrading monooxygenase HmoA
MTSLYDWDSKMSIIKWMNSKKHRVITRTKAKQQNYFNDVFPDAINKYHQFEYSDTDDEEVVTKKKKKSF